MHGKGRRPVRATMVPIANSNIIVASENASTASYRDQLFRTFEPNIWAHYSEEWVQNQRIWHLRQCALHLYSVTTPTSKVEVFAFHCEPGHEGNSITDQCKRGPHVHPSAISSPLAHAHLPLQLLAAEDVLASSGALTEFIRKAMSVISQEIVPRFS